MDIRGNESIRLRDQLACRVRILFQPCEESRPSGARTMCEHGVMRDIDCIAMCHVNCVDPVHVISSNPGVTNSSSVAFTITLGGKSVHVATPHVGIDALAAGDEEELPVLPRKNPPKEILLQKLLNDLFAK